MASTPFSFSKKPFSAVTSVDVELITIVWKASDACGQILRRYGDLEAAQDFLAIGKDVNEGDKGQRTALHYAVAFNHSDIVDELLSSGANLEARVGPCLIDPF